MKKNNLIKISLALLFISVCGLGCKKTQESRLTEGLDLYLKEEYNSSFAVFNKIVNEDPKNIRALFYRAMASRKSNDSEKALLDFERIFELDNNFKMKEQDLYAIGNYNYSQRKDFKKAIEVFSFYIQKYPKTENAIRAYIKIADSYSLQKDFDNALAGYKKIIEVYGKTKSPIEQKAVELAEDGVKFLVENSDFDRKPLFLYADMNNTNDPVKKIKIGNEILAKYPNCNLADDIQFKIAKLYSIEGLNDFDKAQIEYAKLIEKYPNSKFADYARNSISGIDEKYDRKTGKFSGKLH